MKNYLFAIFALSLIVFSSSAAEKLKFQQIENDLEFHRINSQNLKVIHVIYKDEDRLLGNFTNIIENVSDKLLELDPNIRLYKVNYNIFKDHPLDYLRPPSYPGVALFEGDREWFFTDPLNPTNFLKWISNILERKVTMIKTQMEFIKFIGRDNHPKVVALYTSDMTEAIEIIQNFTAQNVFAECKILNVAMCLDDCMFNFRGLNITTTELIMLNPQSEQFPIAYFSARSYTDLESLKTFFYIESLPEIIPVDTSMVAQYFAGYTKYQAIMVLSRETEFEEKNRRFLETFKTSAIQNKREDLFSDRFLHGFVYYDEDWTSFGDIFSLHKDSITPPMIFATVFDRDKLIKYKMDYSNSVFNVENFRVFLDSAKHKGLQMMLRSEPKPTADPNRDVEILVGENFRENVITSSENFIVMFYDDWQDPAQLYTKKIFEYMAQKMRGKTELRKGKDGIFRNEKHLRFGFFNVKKNEVVDYAPHGAPEIVLWPRGFKNQPEHFFMPMTVRALAAWINSIAAECEIELPTEEEYGFFKSVLNTHEQELYDKTQTEFLGEKDLLARLEEQRQQKKAQYEQENPSVAKVDEKLKEKPKPIPISSSIPDAKRADDEL